MSYPNVFVLCYLVTIKVDGIRLEILPQAELVESFGRVAQETNKENAKTMAKVPQKLP